MLFKYVCQKVSLGGNGTSLLNRYTHGKHGSKRYGVSVESGNLILKEVATGFQSSLIKGISDLTSEE
jgi:hypothetical protein